MNRATSEDHGDDTGTVISELTMPYEFQQNKVYKEPPPPRPPVKPQPSVSNSEGPAPYGVSPFLTMMETASKSSGDEGGGGKMQAGSNQYRGGQQLKSDDSIQSFPQYMDDDGTSFRLNNSNNNAPAGDDVESLSGPQLMMDDDYMKKPAALQSPQLSSVPESKSEHDDEKEKARTERAVAQVAATAAITSAPDSPSAASRTSRSSRRSDAESKKAAAADS